LVAGADRLAAELGGGQRDPRVLLGRGIEAHGLLKGGCGQRRVVAD
jgi:hypothetical protein